MSEKLKPCPFCGSDIIDEATKGEDLFFYICHTCGCALRYTRIIDHDKESAKVKAAEAWNRRATKGDREPSLPLLARISYLFGEIVNLNEEIANLRNEVARLTSENIGYREKQSFTKKFGAKGD